MHVSFNIRYHLFWDIEKAWSIVVCSWIYNLFVSIVFTLLVYFRFNYVKYESGISEAIYGYVIYVLHSLFGIFSFITFLFIFILYVCYAVNLWRLRPYQTWLLRRITDATLAIPIMLTWTYLVLNLGPSLSRFALSMMGLDVPYILTFGQLLSARISPTVQGFLYTFLQKPVRELLCKKLSCHRKNGGHEQIERRGSVNSSYVVSTL